MAEASRRSRECLLAVEHAAVLVQTVGLPCWSSTPPATHWPVRTARGGARPRHRAAGLVDLTVIPSAGARHQLHNAINRDEVTDQVAPWPDAHPRRGASRCHE